MVRFRSVVEVGLVSRESRVLSLYKEMVVMTETKKLRQAPGRARRGRATFPFFENFRLPINSARGATFFRSKVSMTMINRSTCLDLQYHCVHEHRHGCVERRCRSRRFGVGTQELPQTGIGSGSLLQEPWTAELRLIRHTSTSVCPRRTGGGAQTRPSGPLIVRLSFSHALA